MVESAYIKFGKIAREKMGMQCQYASRFLDETRYPGLATGVRWEGDLYNYHSLLIHQEDVEVFVERVQNWRRSKGIIL